MQRRRARARCASPARRTASTSPALVGTRLDDEALDEVAASLDDLDPPDDVEASGSATAAASPRRSRGARCATPPAAPRERRRERATELLPIRVEVNGAPREGAVEPRRTLADFLREDLDLTGTHLACEHGFCGSCNVLLDGADRALVPALRRAGERPLGADGRGPRRARRHALAPLQQAFHDHHGLQCGFCTPAMLLTAARVPARPPRTRARTSRSARRSAASLCRCTGYQQIVESIRAAAEARGAEVTPDDQIEQDPNAAVSRRHGRRRARRGAGSARA